MTNRARMRASLSSTTMSSSDCSYSSSCTLPCSWEAFSQPAPHTRTASPACLWCAAGTPTLGHAASCLVNTAGPIIGKTRTGRAWGTTICCFSRSALCLWSAGGRASSCGCTATPSFARVIFTKRSSQSSCLPVRSLLRCQPLLSCTCGTKSATPTQ